MFINDEELRSLYKIASEENLQQLQAGLQHLEKQPEDEVTLKQMIQVTHSLKGDSRLVGLDKIVTLAAEVEKTLVSIKQQETAFTADLSDRLLQELDAISLLVNEAVTDAKAHHSAVNGTATQESSRTFQPTFSLREDEELRDIYQQTSEERLQKLATGLLHFQNHPEDKATLEQLLREIHSLKGDARSVGDEKVVILAAELEKVFVKIKQQETVLTAKVCDCLYQGLDAIGLLVYEAVTDQNSEVNVNQVLQQLGATVVESQPPVTQDEQPSPIIPITTFPVVALTITEDEELRDIYKVTSEERLQRLEAGLLHLQNHPEDQTTLEQLLRETHSLKGDSLSVGLKEVETLTHHFEELLLSIKRQEIVLTSEVCDRLYQGLDAVSLLVQEAVTGEIGGVDTAAVLQQLSISVALPIVQQSLPISSVGVSLFPDSIPPLTPPQPQTQQSQTDTIRIPTRDLDALMTQLEELTITKIAIAHTMTEIEEMANLWEEWKTVSYQKHHQSARSWNNNPYTERLEKIINSLRNSAQQNSSKLDIAVGELREKIRTLRLVPLSTVFQSFPRMVRDLAKQQSKQVELRIEGGDVTVDKYILDKIKDSLMHMIRNAIDHGIETPDEREQLGKPPLATIWLRGYQTTTNVVIEITDDGRGLDTEKIKQTALQRGLYSQEELAIMTPSQIHELIFVSGFSTRNFITEISGRGIGLDVVRANVEQLKGNIQIESTLHQGCSFHIQVSTSLTTINVLLVELQGIIHALPVEFVHRTLLVAPQQIITTEDQNNIDLDGQIIPVANLADILELSQSLAYTKVAKVESKQNKVHCLVLKVGEEQAGLFVDRLLQTQEVVLKPQSRLLKRVRHVAGATILGSGEVAMILDPISLLKSLQGKFTPIASKKLKPKLQRKPVILLVEDSVPVRTQEKRFLEQSGYEVVVAVDGLDGYNKLKTRHFDVVISDVEMPNLDGFSLTVKIRKHPEYQNLPIILVTTLASDEHQKKGSEVGANAYVIKSNFNQDVLLEILRKFV